MSENENFTAEQEAEAVVEQEIEVKTENNEVNAEVNEVKTEKKKKFNILSIVVLVALGIALIMGIVGMCINWLSMETTLLVGNTHVTTKGTGTLKDLLNTNKAYNGQYFNGLEAIEAFGIIAIIMAAFTAASIVVSKFVNIKALKYVTVGMSLLLIVSALLVLILTFNCTNTDICKEIKNSLDGEFAPAEGVWLLAVFGVVGGALGLIAALDCEGKALKEFVRKFIVKLKRRPMNIGLVVLLVSTIVLLCSLGNLSQLGLKTQYQKNYQGLCIFIDILFGILVLVLYLNAFPKRSKNPKWVMYALTIVFMAILIGLDLYLYIMWGKNRAADLLRDPDNYSYWNGDASSAGINEFYFDAVNGVLAHAILVFVSFMLMVFSPIIGKLLNKINTRVVLEDTQLKDKIDVEED